MDKKIPHILGLDSIKEINNFTNKTLNLIEENFTWLNEILETAKKDFQNPLIQTLPKTPSVKKRRGKKRKSDLPSFFRRSSIVPKLTDQSLNDSYALTAPLNTSSSYATRSTRTLRSHQKAITDDADTSISKTSATLRTRNQHQNAVSKQSNTSAVLEPVLSPTKEVPEVASPEIPEQSPPQVQKPKDTAMTEMMQVCEEEVPKIKLGEEKEEQNQQAQVSSDLNKMENCVDPPETASLAIPAAKTDEASVISSECRVNNSSFVIETPSEEESALNLPVISSPVNALSKPEPIDTDSGVTSDDKEHEKLYPHSISSSSSSSVRQGTGGTDTHLPLTTSAVSSEEANEPPRTRTRTRKQQQLQQQHQQQSGVSQLTVPLKESLSSTTSRESNEAPNRLNNPLSSKMRTKATPVNISSSSGSEIINDILNKEKLEEPRTRTRTRLQKRKSNEIESKTESEAKRPCPEVKPVSTTTTSTEKRRSSRLSCKKSSVKESPEDADAEDSEEDDTDCSMVENNWNFKTPKNLSSSRSFLSSMNSSYRSANLTPSQKSYTLQKYIQQNSSFTGSASRSGTQSRLNLLSSGFKSLLKKTATPSKGTPKIGTTPAQFQIEQRKKEFEEKRKKEQERLMKREELQRMKMEERKRKREERMRKVAESRQLKEIHEQQLKDKKNKILEEKLSVTDRVREEKLREEREKLRLRYKKQQEAEERRKQEEEERIKKLKEQEEDNQRHLAMLQRKKEYEEQERMRKMAEEKRKQKERMLEAEKEKQNEMERRKRIEEEREKERLRLKEERERECARQRELQKERQRENEQLQREKLRELEQARLHYEQQMIEKKEQRDQYIAKVLNQPSVVAPLLSSSCQKEIPRPVPQNTSQKLTHSFDSYQMTPTSSLYNNYDITELKSDDSTDEEEGPRKKIPMWAQGPELKISLLRQYYNPPNLDEIFLPIEFPDLNELFVKKKSRFNRRTSSAVWDSPILKSHIPILS